VSLRYSPDNTFICSDAGESRRLATRRKQGNHCMRNSRQIHGDNKNEK
jgi:hypothetical protein